MPVQLTSLSHAELAAARALLHRACPYDRAAEVAEEKLLGPAPQGQPHALGASLAGELVGVACVAGAHVRLIAVAPEVRGRGVGSALLAACEREALRNGVTTLQLLDQPGNYLAPGIDERNQLALAWASRRGFVAGAPRTNLLVEVRENPQVSQARADELAQAAAARGYRVRRAGRDEPALLAAIASEFGGAWPFEVARALEGAEPAVHLAERDGQLCAFAAHDGNNRGLGWFGPAGTWPAHRGQRLGEALLIACLVDVAHHHAQSEIAWIGPEPFYRASCGVAGRRIFLPMRKALR